MFRRLFIGLVGLTICIPVVIQVTNADDQLFPDRVLESFFVKWYSGQLRAMKEPSLWRLSHEVRSITVYRFLWIPSFDQPISVRITESNDAALLHIVKLDNHGGSRPGGISVLRDKKLTSKQWQDFQLRLEKCAFWEMPAEAEVRYEDGDRVILEGVRDGQYHVVHRQSPESGSAYVELCRFILDLSGLKVMNTWKRYHG